MPEQKPWNPHACQRRTTGINPKTLEPARVSTNMSRQQTITQVHGPPTRKMTSQSTAICFFAVSQMVPNLNTNTYQIHHKSTLKFHVQLRKIKPCHVRRPHLVLGVRQPGQLWPWAHLGPASESTFMQVLSKKWCGAWGMRVLG